MKALSRCRPYEAGNTLIISLSVSNSWRLGQLLPCAGCSLNTTDNLLTILLDHLTEFVLLGQAEPITPTPTPTVTVTPAKGYHIY